MVALAQYKQSSGGNPVNAPSDVTKLVSTWTCQTGGYACEGEARQTKTDIDYTISGYNNLLPRQVTSGSGDGALAATTTFGWSAVGDRTSVNGPLGGAGDVTTYRYDDGRRLEGVIGPDPDGAGTDHKHRAVRVTYNVDNQRTIIDRGTLPAPTDPWTDFVLLQRQTTTYGGDGRPTRQALSKGSTTFSVTQFSYDAAKRLDCTAVRMDDADFGSTLPGACTATTPQGADGPDRISRTTYDLINRVRTVTAGYGTSAALTEETTYTANGKVQTTEDGKGNLTTFEYDGVDRLKKVRYPNASGGGSSTTDYETYGYDAASNMTQHVMRATSAPRRTFDFTYDFLNRLQTKDAPGTADDVAYDYDNLGRLTSAALPAQSLTLGFTYDALSRNLTQAQPLGTVSYQYDLAGRRTRMTWPDDRYVTYEYDNTDAVTFVREQGATSGLGVLAAYEYDELGQRTRLTRPTGVVSNWQWDGASRMDWLLTTGRGRPTT